MKYPGFTSGTYTDHSVIAAADRCKNLYPHTLSGAGSPEAQKVLVHTPGYAPLPSFFTGFPVQMMYRESKTGYVFVISNNALYRMDVATNNWIGLGTIHGGPHKMASNGVQLMVSCASDGAGFIVNLSGLAMTQITAPGFMGSSDCVMLDNYFVSLVPVSRKIQISALLDGTQWDALDFTIVEGGPENVVALHVVNGELWVFCEEHTEIWQNTGNPLFPLERIKSIYINQGLAAQYAVCSADNTVFWIGRNKDGWCRVFRADGYVPKGVSTRSVECFFSMYANEGFPPGALRWDATAYSYQNITGHTFVVFSFPSTTSELGPDGIPVTGVISGAQWVYDITENEWHERMQVTSGGVEQMPIGVYHAFAGGKHYVGGPTSVSMFTMSEDIWTYNGIPIKRYRRAPAIVNGMKWIVYHYLRLSAKVGFSPTAGAADDNLFLRVSNDGGMTWTQPYAKSLGHLGEYTKEICWRALGRAKRRVFEISTTVMAPICFMDSDIGVDGEQ